MAEHAVRQEQEVFSLSARPFQKAKESGKKYALNVLKMTAWSNFFAGGGGIS